MAWIGNLLLFAGVWMIGNRQRAGFLFGFVGELTWVVVTYRSGHSESTELIICCLVFATLYLRNWYQWGKK